MSEQSDEVPLPVAYLANYTCFHDCFYERGKKEVVKRAHIQEAAALLSLEGEKQRLGFIAVTALCVLGGKDWTFDTEGLYSCAMQLVQAFSSIQILIASYREPK